MTAFVKGWIAGLVVAAVFTFLLTPLKVTAQGDRTSLFAGTNATTTTAEVLAAAQAVFEVVVQNDPDSTTDLLVGNATVQVIQVAPGQSVSIPASDLSLVYIKSVSGTPTANYLARGR